MSRRRKVVFSEVSDGNRPEEQAQAGEPPDFVVSPPKTTEAVSEAPRQLAPVGLTVFVVASGVKADQIAGFKAWATGRAFGPRTIPEWHGALQRFMSQEVK